MANMDLVAQQLTSPDVDLRIKCAKASDLRDAVDYLCVGPTYTQFLAKFIPIFTKILEGPAVFSSASWQHMLRNSILEIIHRLPLTHVEVVKPYCPGLVDLMMKLLEVENEDNAVLCMKIVMDLQRIHDEATNAKVVPFLGIIQKMFANIGSIVKDTFDNPQPATTNGAAAAAAAGSSTPGGASSSPARPGSPPGPVGVTATEAGADNRQLTRGMQSFKVLAECPIIVVSLFQAHKTIIPKSIKSFIPLVKEMLLTQAEPQRLAHEAAAKRGETQCGVSKDIKNKMAFGEFVTAQVKIMSFLAYLLRMYTEQFEDFVESLPDICVRLLKDCPEDKSATRKELLVAIRHVVNFNFRAIFIRKLDELLDERTLLGDGLTVHETMRPLAFSMLADLIHHLREQLKPPQIQRTIELFSRNMLDDFPGTSFQTMSAKLLLNMADSIAQLEDKVAARNFLVMILQAISDKFEMMNREYPNAVKLSKKGGQSTTKVVKEDHLADPSNPPEWDETDIFLATPIKTSILRDPTLTPVDDNKFLFKNLMTGLKNLFYVLKLTNPEGLVVSPEIQPKHWNEASYGYSAEEVEVISRLFREGSRVFRYFSMEEPPAESNYSSPVEYWANTYVTQISQEEKELIETFATVFHCIDPATFHEVFTREIPHLYELMFEHTTLLHIPQFFLASEATSPSFAGMLLQFLMGKIEEIGTTDIKKSSILLRLFKLSFMAVTLFSQRNEQVLQPHVTTLLTKSIQLSTNGEESLNYFYLLRSLFRSIGGGKFETLYKEILPLLEMLLDVLNSLLLAARNPQEKHLYVELCLTVPARLSNLLPHLSYLMRPLVVALGADTDLVAQGLRTLELCVDNLTAEYLDPIMAPVIDELMQALWHHLQPDGNFFHTHTTLRILGKLGGRNRKFLTGPPQLEPNMYADDEASFDVKLMGATKGRAFPLNLGVDLAVQQLELVSKGDASKKKNDAFYKQQAFRMVSSQLKLYLGYDQFPEDMAQIVRAQVTEMMANKSDLAADLMDRSDHDKSVPKKLAEEQTVKQLLKAVVLSTTLEAVKEQAVPFLENVLRRFVLLEFGRATATWKRMKKPFALKAGEGPICVDSRILADAIVDLLAHDSEDIRKAGVDVMKSCFAVVSNIFGSDDRVSKLPFFAHLNRVFSHSCYEEDWHQKAGGHLGLECLAKDLNLDDGFIQERQMEIVRALMFLIKDIPQDLPRHTQNRALATLTHVLKRCNKEAKLSDLETTSTRLFQLCGAFATDLSHQIKAVREASQKAISVLAETIGVEVWEMIKPIKERLLAPIYNKPLRALQFPVQCGYIDAVTYCLELQHSVIEYNQSFNRLLEETLALTDQEDEKLTAKPNEFRTAENILNCRVSSLRLMTLALSLPELKESAQQVLWNRIIAVFFKSLYQPAKEVSDAANAGLKSVLALNNKLPKDLLQSGLRPILMTLQMPEKITLQALEGLHRLLQLLTNYFKSEIGDRLISFMERHADAEGLLKISFGMIEQDQGMKIVIATLEVFHLLPQAANNMLPKLVMRVMDFEQKLRRTLDSPFRAPLFKFLTRYPQQTWQVFAPKLGEPRFARFFCQAVASPQCVAVAKTIAGDVESLMKATFLNEKANDMTLVAGINLVHTIVQQQNDWLEDKPQVRAALIKAGQNLHTKEKKHTVAPPLRLAVRKGGERIIDIMIIYLEAKKDETDVLFELMTSITKDELRVHPGFKHFLYEKIICSDRIDFQRKVVLRCLDSYHDQNMKPKTKTYFFHNIINPIFAADIQRHWDEENKMTDDGDEQRKALIDASMINSIDEKLWKPNVTPVTDDGSQGQVDQSRLEALQMSALLVKYHRALINELNEATPNNKLTTNISKFVWAYTQSEDTITKYAAFVVFAFLVAQFQSHHKLVMVVYHGLLRAHQSEGRALVIQALDLMAPVLPDRLPKNEREKVPQWARLPKRAIAEDSSNLQQLISVLQFFIRHADMFYVYRDQYISQFLPALPKIAQPPSTSNDNRKLVLNVIEMIKTWEERKLNNKGGRKRLIDGSPKGSSPPKTTPATSADDYKIPTSMRANTIKYLAQLMSTSVERYPVPAAEYRKLGQDGRTPSPSTTTNETCKKAFGLFHDLLIPGMWNDLEVDLFPRMTEAILASEKTDKGDDKTVTAIVNTLQLVRYILNTKTDAWIAQQMPLIEKILEKALRSENSEIQDCLHTQNEEMDGGRQIRPLLLRVIEACPEEKTGEDEMEVETAGTSFVKRLSTIVKEGLDSGNASSSVNILWTLSKARPDMIDQHVPGLIRLFMTKLQKDHMSHIAQYLLLQQFQTPRNNAAEQQRPKYDPVAAEITVELLDRGIDVCETRMAHLGEQRRPFLSVLASLVERSNNLRLCKKVITLTERWIFGADEHEPFPTTKEKTAVLHKMTGFESRTDHTLLHMFLDLVIRVYEDPKITRSELTVRLEHAFLMGTRAEDVNIRNRFMTIFDKSLTRTASARLLYVLTQQNWDPIADKFWLSQALQLMFGAIDMGSQASMHSDDIKMIQPSEVFISTAESRRGDAMLDDNFEEFIASQRRFNTTLGEVRLRDLLDPLCHLQHLDTKAASKLWSAVFPIFWTVLNREERNELEKGMVTLLTKEYNQKQIDKRPNPVQALLDGAVRVKPRIKIPPHVLKFVGRSYDAWYPALTYMEQATTDPIIDTPSVRESNLDALVEMYSTLSEDDLFYGTWRRRCKFVETNAALSYEQNGMWDKAMNLYEQAQVKARTGAIPFSQGEYMLWEDHWVICAQKMQQWDILSDFAKHENFNDLLLEASFRNIDLWQQPDNLESINHVIKGISDAATPRRAFFGAFMSLLKFNDRQVTGKEFQAACEEAMQLSICKWHQLPRRITSSHIPILQGFQQLVELHDAQNICASLHMTRAENLDQKSQELKMLLGSWRDRLPNVWDDINAWQELVTWRQQIFQLINKHYLNLIPQTTGSNQNNSFAYRGFHEIAWIINRFAHVARKHRMPDVCINQLSKIYTLPNIEIQEAFLKLREQAKCHYQNPNELNNGLDVINNTNLNYFANPQKAEFYTLRGMFLAKLGQKDEANEAFGTALYYDIRLPKAWAEWGHYNDSAFKAAPNDFQLGAAAVSCYLEAASLWKNAKARKLLSRVLWLLSIDNAEGKIAQAFEDFKGEQPLWYWVTFIPQLLTSLSHREAPISRNILVRIAKLYPQALFFLLRTNREDMLSIKKSADEKEKQTKAKQQQSPKTPKTEGAAETGSQNGSRPTTANAEKADGMTATSAATGTPKKEGEQQNGQQANTPANGQGNAQVKEEEKRLQSKKPWEYSEEITQVLKTAFPLLALTMETMVDQIAKNFKCPPDEDAYRLIVALLNDGLSYVSRVAAAYARDSKLPSATESNIKRFAETILPSHIRGSFEQDFVSKKPTMFEYIQKLRKWRDKFEEKLDRRPQYQNLESLSSQLSEFRYLRLDEVEVPGQYLLHRDKNQDFTRIERFLPNVDLVRNVGLSHRRLKMRGSDGSIHSFAVHHPAARHCRREERVAQLFRVFNSSLSKRKEARRRNLQFYLPLMVPLAPSVRLVQEDSQYVSLQGVYEDHCRRHGLDKDEPILFTMEKMRSVSDHLRNNQKMVESLQGLRLEAHMAVQQKLVPKDIAIDYFQRIYSTFDDFWLFRRQFSYSFAALTFMSYIMFMTNRTPQKLSIARDTGNVWGTELLPTMNNKAIFHNSEPVPFRLTPNLQMLMGPIAMEGIFGASIMAIARSLTEPEFALEQHLSVFVRDEIHFYLTQQRKDALDSQVREAVQTGSDVIIKRARAFAEAPESSDLPAHQTVIDKISEAVNPMRLAQMDTLFMPYL